jgi:glycosyltransferase 2 family protein
MESSEGSASKDATAPPTGGTAASTLAVREFSLTDPEQRNHRRTVLFWLKLIVSLGLLAFVVSAANLSQVWQIMRDADLLLVITAAATNPVGGTLIALRWQGLLRSQGVDAPIWKLIQSCIVASFFRQFLPSTIGGDAIRAYDSWKMGATKMVAISTLVVDRVLGLVILMLFATIALLLSPRLIPELPLLPLWIALAGGGMACIVLLIFLPKSQFYRPAERIIEILPTILQRPARKVTHSFTAFQGQPRLLLRSLGLSLLLQLNVVLFYVLIGSALGLEMPILAYFIIVPLATVVMMIPVSINAIGLREAVFVLLLGIFAVNTSEALAFAWLEYGLFLLHSLIGGVVYALRR